MSDTTLKIDGVEGPMVVRLVRKGEGYGNERCLTWGTEDRTWLGEDCLVEFYDDRYHGEYHDPLGQFISRYHLSTLRDPQWGSRNDGLNLDGGVPAWAVEGDQMALVHSWLDEVCPETNKEEPK